MDIGSFIYALFNFFALIISFFSLCIVCDEHLVPTVEVFIVQFEVPEEVAAVTLVAFGSAAPELFLNSVSAVVHTSDLSMAAILGSGIIAFGLIPPLCILSAPTGRIIKLKLYPILRECSFYLIGLFVFLGSINDGKIASYEACILIGVYIAYTSVVAVMYFRNKAALAAEHQRLHQNNMLCNNTIDRSVNSNDNPATNTTTSSTSSSNTIHTLQPLSISVSAPILETTQQLALASPTPSPRAEDCHFFPKIGRSNSEILLRRTTSTTNTTTTTTTTTTSSSRDNSNSSNTGSNNNTTTTNMSISTSNRNHSSGMNLVERMDSPFRSTKNANLEESEHANLITADDIESFSMNLEPTDTTNTDPYSNTNSSNSTSSNSIHDNIIYTIVMNIFHSIYIPIEHIVRTLMPSLHPQIPHFISGNTSSIGTRHPVVCHTQVSLKRAVLVLVCCITAIGILAVTIVIFSEAVISQLGFSSTAMGATLVALGAEIPDTVSAVALARNGYYNAAVAGAIGSQVINVTLGVGVPALLVSFFGDGYLRISQLQTDSLVLLTCLLIVVILSYVTVTVPVGRMLISGRWARQTIVSRPGAVFQVCMWALTYVLFLHLNKAENPLTPVAGEGI